MFALRALIKLQGAQAIFASAFFHHVCGAAFWAGWRFCELYGLGMRHTEEGGTGGLAEGAREVCLIRSSQATARQSVRGGGGDGSRGFAGGYGAMARILAG